MLNNTTKNSFSVSELPKNYNFNGLDILKFLCAYMVLTIHIKPFYSGSVLAENVNFWLRSWLCKVAVPFYFTTSGFMLFRKIDLQAIDFSIVKRYSFKILRLESIWYFLLIVGWKGHLWYMSALAFAVILLSVLLKANFKTSHIIFISIIFYIIGLLGDTYYNLLLQPLEKHLIPNIIILVYENLFQTTRNGVFFGFIFVAMGALFAHKRIIMSKNVAV